MVGGRFGPRNSGSRNVEHSGAISAIRRNALTADRAIPRRGRCRPSGQHYGRVTSSGEPPHFSPLHPGPPCFRAENGGHLPQIAATLGRLLARRLTASKRCGSISRIPRHVKPSHERTVSHHGSLHQEVGGRQRIRLVLVLGSAVAAGLTGCSAGAPGTAPQAVAQMTSSSEVANATVPPPTTVGYSGGSWEVRVPAGVTGVIIDAVGGGGGAGATGNGGVGAEVNTVTPLSVTADQPLIASIGGQGKAGELSAGAGGWGGLGASGGTGGPSDGPIGLQDLVFASDQQFMTRWFAMTTALGWRNLLVNNRSVHATCRPTRRTRSGQPAGPKELCAVSASDRGGHRVLGAEGDGQRDSQGYSVRTSETVGIGIANRPLASPG